MARSGCTPKNGRVATHTHAQSPLVLNLSPGLCSLRLASLLAQILDTPVQVLFESKGVIVVRKPATAPVHPIGRFKRCSVTELTLSIRPDISNVWLCHRLDRLVSGCLVLAKEKKAAAQLMKCFVDGCVQKTYMARVQGRFASFNPRYGRLFSHRFFLCRCEYVCVVVLVTSSSFFLVRGLGWPYCNVM